MNPLSRDETKQRQWFLFRMLIGMFIILGTILTVSCFEQIRENAKTYQYPTISF